MRSRASAPSSASPAPPGTAEKEQQRDAQNASRLPSSTTHWSRSPLPMQLLSPPGDTVSSGPSSRRTATMSRCRRWPGLLPDAGSSCLSVIRRNGGSWRGPAALSSWSHGLLPVCPRCHRALAEVGREGRVLKATGERWHLGDTVRIFESRRAPSPVDSRPALAHNRSGRQ